MGSNKKKVPKWQTANPHLPFAPIYIDLLQSEAYKSLSPKAQVLYICMASQHYGKNKPPGESKECFYFNRWKYCNEYGLFADGNDKDFYKYRDELILKGFIKIAEQVPHKRIVYQYSDKWLYYGKPFFRLEASELSSTIIKKWKEGTLPAEAEQVINKQN